MYVCTKCDKQIKSSVATYEEKYYHPECLCCSTCGQTLSGKQFIKEKSNKLVCVDCNRKTAPKCKKCRQVFGPGVKYKKLGDDLFFHMECFQCVGPCRKPIQSEFYELDDNRFLCTECYDKHDSDIEKFIDNNNNETSSSSSNKPTNETKPPVDKLNNMKLEEKVEKLPAVQREREPQLPQTAPPQAKPTSTPSNTPKSGGSSQQPAERLCAKCNQKLSGTVTTYDKKQYHSKCFVCCQCGEDFKDNSFFKLNGEPLCRNCHSLNLVEQSSKCFKCKQPILDTVVTFKNNEYHDYCLSCTACSKSLVGVSIYTDRQDMPFCVECYTAREGKYCAKCGKLIAPTQSNLVFEAKNFHKECFTCKKCQRVIGASESFYKDDDDSKGQGIICGDCIDK